MPRSIRCTASSRPQTCAISVALLDQGEIVPSRGTTRRVSPTAAVEAPIRGPYVRRRSRTSRSAGVRARFRSAKWTNRVSRALTAGSRACSLDRSLAIRKADSAGAPGIISIITSGQASLLVGRGRVVQGHGELGDIGAAAFDGRDFAGALLFDLVDPKHRMHGQKRPLHPFEFALDAFLARIQNDAGTLAEQHLFDLDKSEQFTMTDLAGIDLVNLALIH